ncbi:MAG: hypothetical protein WB392_14355 [Methanotrichaceae archaeon]
MVHDLLAFLAEQMLEMNKLKDFNSSGRDNQEELRREFDASVGKLQPLMGRIKDTDTLIDEIVYRLYGLTEEEIKIVEGAI